MNTPEKKIPAYSTATGIEYESWNDLVSEETNGYVVVGISNRPRTVPKVVGPYPDKTEADKARRRLRRRWRNEEGKYGFTVTTYVLLLWKDVTVRRENKS